MGGAVGRARRKAGEVVERLVVVLEIGHGARVAMLERVLPRAAWLKSVTDDDLPQSVSVPVVP